MANLFILNIADRQVAPVAADKNCNALIARAVSVLAGGSDVPTAPEPIDVDARRAALFGEVTSGALSMDDAVAALCRGRFARWRAHRHDHHVSGLSP
jgi:hypothetical protein